ncbi:MAG: hypothetical protein QM493_08395 [Sulfurovum sp.]
MNLTQRKAYYNLCNPYIESIDDKYILDIDGFEIDGRALNVRGEEHLADEIVTQISWSNTPQSIYFTGYSGSGKTTELKRVMNRLESSEEGNLLAIYINIIDYADINSPIDLSDILTIITYKVIEGLGVYQGKSEADIFGENDYFGRLWHWLKDTNISFDTFNIDVGGASIVANIKETPQFRKLVKESINDNFSKYKRDIFEELNKINEVVKRYEKNGIKKDGIVVVIDQLEKNRGTSVNVDEVKEAIEKVFANRDNLALPIDVIYTIPSYLSTKKSVGDISFLPVVKVINRDDTPSQDGIEVMKSFIEKRIPKDDLKEILGDDYISKLEYIIKATGGYPRDLLKIIQAIITTKNYPNSIADIDKALKSIDNDFQEFLISHQEYKDELIAIYESKALRHNEDIIYNLFNAHAIFRYMNGELWFNTHPSINKLLGLNIDGNGTR